MKETKKDVSPAAILDRNDKAKFLINELLHHKRIERSEYKIIDDSLYEVPQLLYPLLSNCNVHATEVGTMMTEAIMHVLKTRYPNIVLNDFFDSIKEYLVANYV